MSHPRTITENQDLVEVYRIEHCETGLGPFQTNDEFTQELVKVLAANSGYFPGPADDGLGLARIPHSYVFGCPSLETLKRWILLGSTIEENDNIVKTLSDKGFCVKYYLVERDYVILGIRKTQLAFSKCELFGECVSEQYPLEVLMRESPMVFDILNLSHED